MGDTRLFEVIHPLHDLTGNVLDAVNALESSWILLQFLVEIIGEHFENEAQMLPESERVLEPNDSVIVRALYLIHKFEKLDLSHKALWPGESLILCYLNGDCPSCLVVLTLNDCSKCASAEFFQSLVAECQMVALYDLIESFLGVEPVVVYPHSVPPEATYCTTV